MKLKNQQKKKLLGVVERDDLPEPKKETPTPTIPLGFLGSDLLAHLHITADLLCNMLRQDPGAIVAVYKEAASSDRTMASIGDWLKEWFIENERFADIYDPDLQEEEIEAWSPADDELEEIQAEFFGATNQPVIGECQTCGEMMPVSELQAGALCDTCTQDFLEFSGLQRYPD